MGASLIEVMVASLGLLLVVTLTSRAFADLSRVAAAQRERGTRLQSTRIVRSVLRAELSGAYGSGNVSVFPPDSIRLRAFRGMANVCPRPRADGAIVVSWEGVRRPDPAKDSLLMLGLDGDWAVADLVRVSKSPVACPEIGDVPLERWTLEPSAGDIVLVRLFESGSYHVSDGVLRYRTGRSGRQPLTEAVQDAAITFDGSTVRGEWTDPRTGTLSRHFLARIGTGR